MDFIKKTSIKALLKTEKKIYLYQQLYLFLINSWKI